MKREQELVKLESSESLLVLDKIITQTNLLRKKIDPNDNTNHQKDLPLSTDDDREEIVRFKISTLSKIINFCSPLNERSTEHSEELREIKEKIINLITSDPDICRVENYSASILSSELATGVSLCPEKLQSLNENSLLCNIFASVPNNYNADIINATITNCIDLKNRPDLVLVMIDQKTISSDLNMLETFNLLAQRNLPLPSDQQMKALLTNSRLNSGSNASKLARSFLSERDENLLIKYILKYQYDGKDRQTKARALKEQKELKSFLINEINPHNDSFKKHVRCAIELNDDDLLKKLLQKNASPANLAQIEDHAEILRLAAKNKLTKTFEILIEAGFDPLKHKAEGINPFAFACQTQSKIPLEIYLDVIRKKFGEEKVIAVINEIDDSNKTPLTYAIEGRAYIDAINFLLDNGADVKTNYQHNLKVAAENKHAGALDLLLKKGDPEKSDIAGFTISSEDYVIDSVLLEYVKDNKHKDEKGEIAKKLKARISKKILKPEDLKPEDLIEICKVGGGKTLEYYIRDMKQVHPDYTLSSHVNDLDQNKKTPLYYAINNNAYNRTVSLLLSNGANLNIIGYEDENLNIPINALSLAIKNKESSTLEILLDSSNLSPDTISKACEELIRPENDNLLLTKAFIEGLTVNQLTKLSPDSRQVLLNRSLESDLITPAKKILDSNNGDLNSGLDRMLLKAIQDSRVKLVCHLVNDLKIKNEFTKRSPSTSITTSTSSPEDLEVDNSKDSAPLIDDKKKVYSSITAPSTSISSNSSPNRLTNPIDAKYLDAALKAAKESSDDSQYQLESKAVLQTLLNSDFKFSLSDKDLKFQLRILGIDGSKCCPTSCAIM
jgi:hypothetical protein